MFNEEDFPGETNDLTTFSSKLSRCWESRNFDGLEDSV